MSVCLSVCLSVTLTDLSNEDPELIEVTDSFRGRA